MNSSKYVIFGMGDEQFAVNIEQVDSIERVSEMTKVPQAPHFMQGFTDLRGEVISVVDLKALLDIGTVDLSKDPRLIIAQIENLKIALLVDEAKEVLDLESDIVEESPKMVGGVKKEYIQGVARLEDRLIIIMNMNNVLNVNEIEQIKAANE